jgi:hypothetical protein
LLFRFIKKYRGLDFPRKARFREWKLETYLQQRADKTLKWTLGTFLGEWRLCLSAAAMRYCKRTSSTHTLRGFNVLYQHNQLLLADETLEARVVRVIQVCGDDERSRAMPFDVLCLRKEILHQLLLAREFNFNMALAQSTTSTSSAIGLEAVDSVDSLIEIDKLDVAVESFACDTLHDNVDWLIILLIDYASIATKECKDFRAVHTIRDLQTLSIRFSWTSSIEKLTFLILTTPKLASLASLHISTKGKFFGSRASSKVG